MSDVWTALLEGISAYGQTRAARYVSDSFSDTKMFVQSLAEDRAINDTVKQRFEAVKHDVENVTGVFNELKPKLEPLFERAKTAVGLMKDDVDTDPFTLEAAARFATDLSSLLQAIDEAILVMAEILSKDAQGHVQESLRDALGKGITDPWKRPFRDAGNAVSSRFDKLVKQLLDVDDASGKIAERVTFDRAGRELRFEFAKAPRKQLGPVSIEQTSLIGFVNYAKTAVVGVRLRTRMEAGIRSDKLLEKVIPGGNNPSAESTMITLDSDQGLSFGEGKSHKVTLPVRFSLPGVELREFTIAKVVDEKKPGEPAAAETSHALEVYATVAAKIGDVMGLVIEGTGVTVTWKDGDGDALDFAPRLPTGLGVRVDAKVVTGGGFIRREGKEYSGILDLKLFKLRVTAIAVLVSDPFSFVVLLSVKFTPAIELGLGFTLNGIGGILAVERRVAADALAKSLSEGTVDNLLFPDNPIEMAPTILTKVKEIFPAQSDAFAVGPMAELGWGSQGGFVTLKLGVVLTLPDPSVLILGSLRVGVPSPGAPDALKVVDLRADIMISISPDRIVGLASIHNSKMAGASISGDLGFYIAWGGDADFALSAGGFFPGYQGPGLLANMRRLAVDVSPPIQWIKLHAEAYFAITTNSVQFGGALSLMAELGPAQGKAWFSLDALFRWSPRFYFEVRITAGISISVFGEDLVGVSFKGQISGTTPWSLEGHASVTLLFWDFDFDIGPITWGATDTSDVPSIDPVQVVAAALSKDDAWQAQLPGAGDALVVLAPDNETPLLVHPLAAVEVKQAQVPLETDIDRIGRSRVTARRVNLSDPQVAGVSASTVSHAEDRFAPGQFITLSDEQQISRPPFELRPAGLRLSATRSASFGPSAAVACEIETVFPGLPEPGLRLLSAQRLSARQRRVAISSNRVSAAARARGNRYLRTRDPVELRDPAVREVRAGDALAPPAAVSQPLSYSEARHQALEVLGAGDDAWQLLSVGVTP